jgi:hypothetical protein
MSFMLLILVLVDSKCRCCHIWNEKINKEKNRILAAIDGKCRRFYLDEIRVYYTNKTLKLLIVNACVLWD